MSKKVPESAEESPTEPKSDVLEVPFRDGMVTVPRARGKWPTRAILAFEKGDNLKAVEVVLGPVQWDLVMDSEIEEFEAFCEAFGDIALREVFEG